MTRTMLSGPTRQGGCPREEMIVNDVFQPASAPDFARDELRWIAEPLTHPELISPIITRFLSDSAAYLGVNRDAREHVMRGAEDQRAQRDQSVEPGTTEPTAPEQMESKPTMTSRPEAINIPIASRLWHRISQGIVYLIILVALGVLLVVMAVVMLVAIALRRAGDRQTARREYLSEGNRHSGADGGTVCTCAARSVADDGAGSTPSAITTHFYGF